MDLGNEGQTEPILPSAAPLTDDPAFDILEWYPAHQSCQRYFLDIAQYESGTQALCALINIRLPFQWSTNPLTSSAYQRPASGNAVPITSFPQTTTTSTNTSNNPQASSQTAPSVFVSLIPYLRRLVITGFDKPAILHGFFGDDYVRGIMPHLDCERRNYLFSAKAGGWRSCKKQYDIGSGRDGNETVPFMKPLGETRVEEITAAEKAWSGWLAMEDWMVGPRAPTEAGGNRNRTGRDSALGAPSIAESTNGPII